MKFGKNLLEVVELSHPEWAPFWMDYKMLKKRLKDMTPEAPPPLAGPATPARVAIAADAAEIAFFRHLMGELHKTVEFFRGAETEFRIRMTRVREGVRQLVQRSSRPPSPPSPLAPNKDAAAAEGGPDDGAAESKEGRAGGPGAKEDCEGPRAAAKPASAMIGLDRMIKAKAPAEDCPRRGRALTACVRIYKDLLLLETYAVMSYCGFSKILKKHDKLTGYVTRTQYMNRVVNSKPFTKYQGVMRMLRECEELFRILSADVGPGAPAAPEASAQRTRGADQGQGGSPGSRGSPTRPATRLGGAGRHPSPGAKTVPGEGVSLSEWSDDTRRRLALQEEEQLFIDVIRNLNSEATTLMKDEQAEVEAESRALRSATDSDSTLSDISSITSGTEGGACATALASLANADRPPLPTVVESAAFTATPRAAPRSTPPAMAAEPLGAPGDPACGSLPPESGPPVTLATVRPGEPAAAMSQGRRKRQRQT